jgi:hypothetical protein
VKHRRSWQRRRGRRGISGTARGSSSRGLDVLSYVSRCQDALRDGSKNQRIFESDRSGIELIGRVMRASYGAGRAHDRGAEAFSGADSDCGGICPTSRRAAPHSRGTWTSRRRFAHELPGDRPRHAGPGRSLQAAGGDRQSDYERGKESVQSPIGCVRFRESERDSIASGQAANGATVGMIAASRPSV